MRRSMVAGNWKMNGGGSFTKDFFERWKAQVWDEEVDVVFCVPFTDLITARENSPKSVRIGAQNMYFEERGAFTGEISSGMLREAGVEFVILGHSERRLIFGESDSLIAKKVRAALDASLTPILCCGEDLEERNDGIYRQKLRSQLSASLHLVRKEEAGQVIIAYEPIWAIGTGRTATPEIVAETVAMLRTVLEELFTGESQHFRILYGGSVKSDNIKKLMEIPDIDGVLVGGASLQPEEFAKIVNYGM